MPGKPSPIDPRRFRRLRRFFLRVVVHALFWDLLMNVRPLRRWRRPALPRWLELARRGRLLAIEMGGVMIKLGQFLSTRGDIIPPEITDELGGLQDEVPPARFAEVLAQIEEDFARPAGEVFAHLDPEPMGAASLAQVHGARLPSGEEVVVKVLRPGIDVLVETDLAAIKGVLRWLKLWRRVRIHVDLDRLFDEFVRTTRRELDLEAEGRHAERFGELFADDGGIGAPKVYWPQSARRTLTLENVAFIKADDLEALAGAGIDRRDVARRLFDCYLLQVFDYLFVHADPHPGNLFVKPLGEKGDGNRDFQLIFVDFGMVAEIPERLRGGVRDFAIGVGSRDAYRIVQAYQQAGLLLPGADLKRLEDAVQLILDRFYGVQLGALRDVALSEMGGILKEYRDLVLEMPFQMQIDLTFVDRAANIVIGLTTRLDPAFDVWAATKPFAQRLIREGGILGGEGLAREIVEQLRIGVELPRSLDQLVRQMRRGNLTVRSTLGTDTRRAVLRLEGAVVRLAWVVMAMGFLLAGTQLWIAEASPWLTGAALGLSGLALLWTVVRWLAGR